MRPLPDEDLRRELVTLDAKCIPQRGSQEDFELRMEIYLAELKAFPGDVVRDVLRNWPGKFFPAYVELKEAIREDRRIRERRQRIKALDVFLNGEEEPAPKPKPTQEQIDRNADYVRSVNGDLVNHVYGDEQLARLEAVDRAHGHLDGYKRDPAKFKSIGNLVREQSIVESKYRAFADDFKD